MPDSFDLDFIIYDNITFYRKFVNAVSSISVIHRLCELKPEYIKK